MKNHFNSESDFNVDKILREIQEFGLSSKTTAYNWQQAFHDHLSQVAKFRLLSEDDNLDIDEFELDDLNYTSLCQYALENANFVEQDKEEKDINWKQIDLIKETLKSQISGFQSEIKGTKIFEKLTEFSIDAFENWCIYEQMYPNSKSNPFDKIKEILKNGYLIGLFEDKNAAELNGLKMLKQDIYPSNLFLVAANQHSCFSVPLPNLWKMQCIVLDFLKKQAKPQPKKAIADFLRNEMQQKSDFEKIENAADVEQIKRLVLQPLKETGLVGSSTKGYFYIKIEKLLEHIKHNEELLEEMKKNLLIYENRASKLQEKSYSIAGVH